MSPTPRAEGISADLPDTNHADMSSDGTKSRARAASIELLVNDIDLVQQCDYILSIVPPRDALKTAERIHTASRAVSKKDRPLYYLDLNAVAPRTARQTAALFEMDPNVRLIDGGIIGGVPYPKTVDYGTPPEWHCPNLLVSGPYKVPDEQLAKILNIDHMGDAIGAATGLKMCFAVTTKGFVSLAIQSFTTAYNLGVLPQLQAYLDRYNPSTLKLAEKGLVTMPPKAYRWVHEMLEIAETMADDGGFEQQL